MFDEYEFQKVAFQERRYSYHKPRSTEVLNKCNVWAIEIANFQTLRLMSCNIKYFEATFHSTIHHSLHFCGH